MDLNRFNILKFIKVIYMDYLKRIESIPIWQIVIGIRILVNMFGFYYITKKTHAPMIVYLFALSIVLLCLGVFIFVKNREGLANLGCLNPSSLSNSLLLNPEYKSRTPPQLATTTIPKEEKNVPKQVSSYEQKTNNIEYWSLPNNGTAFPTDIASEGFYKPKTLEKTAPQPAPPIQPKEGVRVGYFVSDVGDLNI